MKEDVVVSIDVGSSKVATVIGMIDARGWVEVLGKGFTGHKGIRKGIIIDIDMVAQAIAESVSMAEKEAGLRICSAYINLFGMHAALRNNKTSLPVANRTHKVTENEINALMKKVCKVEFPVGWALLDIIPKEFTIDQYDGIIDPLGMTAAEVGVEADIIFGNTTYVQSLLTSLERAGIKVDGFVPEALAESCVVLSDDEKDKGVVLLNIGGTITDISVFANGKLIMYTSIPVGGQHITNDLSVCLKIPMKEAERTKRKYEIALSELIENDQDVFVKDIETSKRKTIKVSDAVEIIEARIYDIFEVAAKVLEESGMGCRVRSVVLSGAGIHYMDGAAQMAEETFKLPVKLASWRSIGSESPEFGMAVSLVNYVSTLGKNQMKPSEILSPDDEDKIPQVGFQEVKRKLKNCHKKLRKVINKIF